MNILYCGDDEFASPYILGSLEALGHEADWVPADAKFPGVGGAELLILSDYPARMMGREASAEVTRFVGDGGSLMMLGGWESFNGLGHNYHGHPVASLLPVTLAAGDDRVNAWQGMMMRGTADARALRELRWEQPPILNGYNRATPKEQAQVLVEMCAVESDGEKIRLGSSQALVVGGAPDGGHVLACLTDLAPHWCGGLVDWGETTVTLPTGKDVGSDYVGFMDLLIAAVSG